MSYFAVASGGSGGNQTARVYGPYADLFDMEQANGNLVIGHFQVLGDQTGYATQAQAQAEVNSWNKSSTHAPVPGSADSSNPLKAASVPSPLSGIASIFQSSIWIRVAEVVFGLVLVAVGVAKMTGTQNFISQAAKVAVP